MAQRTSKILFVTGRQGAGKSALADALAAARKITHFDGDIWALGFDPTLGPSPPPESKVEDDTPFKERHAKISTFLAKFREAETVPDEPEAWQPFYEAMCADVLRLSASGRPIVVTHSVYLKSMRAFIKQQLGDSVTFLFVNPPAELAIKRAAERCAQQYAAMGKSAEEWAALLGPNSAGFQDPTAEEEAALRAVAVSNVEQGVPALVAEAEKLLTDFF